MSKFKIGDRVRLLRNGYGGSNTDEGVLGTIIPHNPNHRGDCQVQLPDYPYGLGFYDYELELIGGTMEDLQKGDVVLNNYGSEYTVAARLEDLVFLVDGDGDADGCYTIDELKRSGYTLKTETPVTEKTVAELEKELKMAPGSLRVKGDE